MKNAAATPIDQQVAGRGDAGGAGGAGGRGGLAELWCRVARGVIRGIARAAVLLGVIGGSPDGLAQQVALVTTDAVVEQSFTQTIPIVGRLIAQQSGAATSRIDGTVSAMRVRVGDRVRRGQVLATLDTDALALWLALAEAQHTEAGARLETARAQLALAGQEVKRLSGLTDSAAVSRAAYDDARQRRAIAAARVQEATAAAASSAAQVRLAELDLSYADIKAPFDGAITARLTEEGSYLQRGQAVAQLVSDRRLELEADIPHDRLGGLEVGGEVGMLLDNGSAHRAIARAIIPEEDPRTRTRRVRFTTEIGDAAEAETGALAAQQSVTVLIPAGAQRSIVSVHKDAIVQRGRDKIVFVVVDGRAAARSIRAGESTGERIEVLDGLQPGDRAVVRGNERLQPDQPVTAAPLAPDPSPAAVQ